MNTWVGAEPSRFLRGIAPFRTLHSPFVGALCFLRRNAFLERGLYLGTGRSRGRLKEGPVLEGYRFPYPTPLSRIATLAFTRNIPFQPGDLNWEKMSRIKEALPSFTAPCRVVWGALDSVFPVAFARAFHDLLPHCREPRLIADGGHFVQEDAPAEIGEEIIALLEEVF